MASTDPGSSPTPERPPRTHQRPSFTQVAASALAAVSAALISSTFGVAGTLIGTAIASVMASVGSTLYLASLRRTNDQLRRVAVAARRTDWSNALATRPSRPAPAPPRPRLLLLHRVGCPGATCGRVCPFCVAGGSPSRGSAWSSSSWRSQPSPRSRRRPASASRPSQRALVRITRRRLPDAEHRHDPGPVRHSLSYGRPDQYSERERVGECHSDGRRNQPGR